MPERVVVISVSIAVIWGGRALDGSGGSGAAAAETEVGGGTLREATGEFGLVVS